MPTSLPYATLNTFHPEYDELETKKLQLLYEGGSAIEKHANLFIHRELMETSEQAYHSRLKCVSYRNYFAKIINDYVSDLASKPFSMVPASDASDSSTPGTEINTPEADKFWREFASNADLRGSDLINILSEVMTEGLACGRSYIGVDFPKVDAIPQSKAEEDALGSARAYTICIPTLSVIDWDVDEFGKYRYVILKNETIPRKSFLDKREKKVIQFKVWEKEDNIVKFSVYEIVCKIDKEPKKDDPCVLIDEGVVSFKDIPVLCLSIPTQLWIGGLIGNLCAEHLRRSSSLVYAMNKNLFSIPFYQQGGEFGANGAINTSNENPHRGAQTLTTMKAKGWAVGSTDDKLSFVEPDGKAYEIVNAQLKELVDAIHAVVNQMGSTVASHSVSLSRSGLSKMMDNHSKELVLSSYAQLLKEFSIKLYTLIAGGRNEDIIWSPKGMSDFKMIDREALIAEATQINAIRAIAPSRTWYKHNALRLIREIDPNLTPQEQLTIQDEVNQYYDKMKDDELLPKQAIDVAMESAKNKQIVDKPMDKKVVKDGK